MINKEISDIILSRLSEDSLVLDIGGGRMPWFRANYIIDKRRYENRVGDVAFGGREEQKQHFNKDTWIEHDFYDLPWPFEDGFFDFSVCMGTLEDLRDPLVICQEIQRVSKAGYISTPTRAAESFFNLSLDPRSNNLPGYFHHRWFVEILNGGLIFTMKTPLIIQHKRWQVKKFKQHTLNFFWDKNFQYKEHYVGDHAEALRDLKNFYQDHKNWLKNFDESNIETLKRYNYWPDGWEKWPAFQSMFNPIEKKLDNRLKVKFIDALSKKIFIKINSMRKK
ncbi:MAG: class I SAM-dependent methyltransferase [Patescibacteria group bacterium]